MYLLGWHVWNHIQEQAENIPHNSCAMLKTCWSHRGPKDKSFIVRDPVLSYIRALIAGKCLRGHVDGTRSLKWFVILLN